MSDTSLLRLLHLASPSLPTGAFAYSQAVEWAVDAGWIQDGPDLKGWLHDLLRHNLSRVDIPLLKRMRTACETAAVAELTIWCDVLFSLRETLELRLEERHRGRAMATLLEGLQVPLGTQLKPVVESCQLAGYALAAAHWRIPLAQAATGYLWSWLENQVLAGIKLIPLGQTEGHRILLQSDSAVYEAVTHGLAVQDEDIGASSPALAIASSCHETQYSRLYRS